MPISRRRRRRRARSSCVWASGSGRGVGRITSGKVGPGRGAFRRHQVSANRPVARAKSRARRGSRTTTGAARRSARRPWRHAPGARGPSSTIRGGAEGLHPVHERRRPTGIIGDATSEGRRAIRALATSSSTGHVINCTGSGSPERDDLARLRTGKSVITSGP